jgi:flagellar biosynthesis component FlhA
MAITDGYAIGPQCLVWAHRTRLEKEMKEEAEQRAGRIHIIRLKDKVDMLLANGETPY